MPRKAPLSQTANEMEVDDDDEMPPPKPQQRKKRKGPKDSTPVMDGQTEEERRILRQEQRNLQDRIGERRAAMCALDSDEFAEQRDANNGLFKKVRYNREMVNDGDIMVGLAECAVARAGALAKSVKQYGAKDICTALKESYSNSRGEMDWAALGRDGAGLFRAPPELNFFCGPLERPVKERKKAERKKKADLKDDGVEETQYQQKEGGADGDTVRAQCFYTSRAALFIVPHCPHFASTTKRGSRHLGYITRRRGVLLEFFRMHPACHVALKITSR